MSAQIHQKGDSKMKHYELWTREEASQAKIGDRVIYVDNQHRVWNCKITHIAWNSSSFMVPVELKS
jgi:hypothetical protein